MNGSLDGFGVISQYHKTGSNCNINETSFGTQIFCVKSRPIPIIIKTNKNILIKSINFIVTIILNKNHYPKHFSVGEGRLELPWITPLVPKTSAATNYATRPAFTYARIFLRTCPPTRIRTWDPPLKRRLLYQLSYRRIHTFYIFTRCLYNTNSLKIKPGARGGNRTRKSFSSRHFKCRMFTNFITWAFLPILSSVGQFETVTVWTKNPQIF